jgi:hypothetical protein
MRDRKIRANDRRKTKDLEDDRSHDNTLATSYTLLFLQGFIPIIHGGRADQDMRHVLSLFTVASTVGIRYLVNWRCILREGGRRWHRLSSRPHTLKHGHIWRNLRGRNEFRHIWVFKHLWGRLAMFEFSHRNFFVRHCRLVLGVVITKRSWCLCLLSVPLL